MAAFIGKNSLSRKIKKIYVGVNGVARRVKKAYLGAQGIAHMFLGGGVQGYTFTLPTIPSGDYGRPAFAGDRLIIPPGFTVRDVTYPTGSDPVYYVIDPRGNPSTTINGPKEPFSSYEAQVRFGREGLSFGTYALFLGGAEGSGNRTEFSSTILIFHKELEILSIDTHLKRMEPTVVNTGEHAFFYGSAHATYGVMNQDQKAIAFDKNLTQFTVDETMAMANVSGTALGGKAFFAGGSNDQVFLFDKNLMKRTLNVYLSSVLPYRYVMDSTAKHAIFGGYKGFDCFDQNEVKTTFQMEGNFGGGSFHDKVIIFPKGRTNTPVASVIGEELVIEKTFDLPLSPPYRENIGIGNENYFVMLQSNKTATTYIYDNTPMVIQ